MARLIYAINTSLDGYSVDADGSFDWSEPSEEVHQFFNDLIRPVGTHLYGRRMYEVMSFWESIDATADEPAVMIEFGQLWQQSDKVVFSTTLTEVTTSRTRVEPTFAPADIAAWKASSESDLSIGGPELAAAALQARLVDDIHLIVAPIILGGGRRALPDAVRSDLALVSVDRFDTGALHLHYRLSPP
jgi:dihydrofolate reductase